MRLRSRTWKNRTGSIGRALELDLGIDPATGKRRRKQFRSRAEARAWLKSPEAEPPAADPGTLHGAGAAWIAAVKGDGRARITWTKYQSHLDMHIAPTIVAHDDGRAEAFGDWRLATLKTPACLRFKRALQDRGLSSAMVGKVMGSLRMLLNHAALTGSIAGNPATPVRAKRGERHREPVAIPTPAQMRLILAALNAGAAAPTLGQVWINLAVATGLRPGEMRALMWDCVALDARPRCVVVRRAADERGSIDAPKTRAAYRKVPLPADAADLLLRWRKTCPASPGFKQHGGLVFPTSAGHVQNLSNIHSRVWRPLLRALGLTRDAGRRDAEGKPVFDPLFTLYALRHFYASLLIARGENDKRLQHLIGHESIQTTKDVYGHLWADARADQATARAVGKALAGGTK
jgi:integrase